MRSWASRCKRRGGRGDAMGGEQAKLPPSSSWVLQPPRRAPNLAGGRRPPARFSVLQFTMALVRLGPRPGDSSPCPQGRRRPPMNWLGFKVKEIPIPMVMLCCRKLHTCYAALRLESLERRGLEGPMEMMSSLLLLDLKHITQLAKLFRSKVLMRGPFRKLERTIGSTVTYDSKEATPLHSLVPVLKPYKKEALFLMFKLEKWHIDDEAKKTIDPYFCACSIADKPTNPPVYPLRGQNEEAPYL